MLSVSLVVPYIDQFDALGPALEHAYQNAGADFELVLIDNGSEKPYDKTDKFFKTKHIHNKINQGVVQSFKQGCENSTGDVILFIHSDVLIHSPNWVQKVAEAFETDTKLGLGGFFGARAIGEDGGRIDSMSNMAGKIWGKCDCHPIAGAHHGNIVTNITQATILDGLAIAFRRETLQRMIDETDMFMDNRSPFHFYDKVLSLKTIKLGYHVAVIPIEFDHMSGATAVRSNEYRRTMKLWLEHHGMQSSDNPDQDVYDLAEHQMFDEFGALFPITVDGDYNYYTRGELWVA